MRPAIKPDTAIISDGELFPFVGLYSTSTGLNLLYPQPEGRDSMAYWFYSMGRGLFRQVPELLAGKKLKTSFRTFNFNGSSKDSLVIYYEPAEGRCLWVLSPEDQELRDLPELTLSILPVSNLDRIEPESSSPGYPAHSGIWPGAGPYVVLLLSEGRSCQAGRRLGSNC